MISNLPRDLVEDILPRLPLTSMRAVRLTCKKWNSLAKSRSFSKMHISKEAAATSEGESRMVMLVDYKLYLTSVVVNGDPFTEPKGKLTCLNEQVKVFQVYHCEGLLLCIVEADTKGDIKAVVWNPYLGQTRWIELGYSHQSDSYALGYVNKKSCRKHVLLRHTDDLLRYEIYDFDSDSWTALDVTPHCHVMVWSGVSLKGNIYFCVTRYNSSDDHIICFDFTSERFGPLLPLPFNHVDDYYVTLSCVREEKLAAVFQHIEINPCEIWITTKIEAENISWSKFLTVDTELISRSFFIDEEKKVVIGFDDEDSDLDHHKLNIIGEAGYFRQLNLELEEPANKTPHTQHVCSYVPSLVQIKQKGCSHKPVGRSVSQIVLVLFGLFVFISTVVN